MKKRGNYCKVNMDKSADHLLFHESTAFNGAVFAVVSLGFLVLCFWIGS